MGWDGMGWKKRYGGKAWEKRGKSTDIRSCNMHAERPEKWPSLHPISTPVNVEHDGLDGPNKTAGNKAAGRFHETEILTSWNRLGRLVPKSRDERDKVVRSFVLLREYLLKAKMTGAAFGPRDEGEKVAINCDGLPYHIPPASAPLSCTQLSRNRHSNCLFRRGLFKTGRIDCSAGTWARTNMPTVGSRRCAGL